jgi:RNA polymerase sigma-70 factor (ECF subfamily)
LQTEDPVDWEEIALLYSRLLELQPSPVVALNRAVAVALAHGAEAGLDLIDRIDGLEGYYLMHAARADLLRRLDRPAGDAYARAIELAPTEIEREFLRSRAL